VLIEAWRRHYNTVRPHSSLGYRPPALRNGDIISGLRFRFAPPPSGYGGDELNALTNQSVHSVGADQAASQVVEARDAGLHLAPDGSDTL
jgi:hypothetical protein